MAVLVGSIWCVGHGFRARVLDLRVRLRARTGPPRAEERANPSVGLETRARAQGAVHICMMTCRSVRATRASTRVCYPHG